MSKSIQVGIRVKPSNGTIHVWNFDSTNSSISLANNNQSEYKFNRVFLPETQTSEIYQDMASDVINGFMEGYNGTIFAYGSTGSGKTFTMMGNEEYPGITPLAVSHIFEHIRKNPSRNYAVGVSYFEIYNENIKDLLRNREHNKNEKIKFDVLSASSYEQVMSEIVTAEANRATGATSMNEHSSRSHAIIRIDLESSPADGSDGIILKSVLNLIDLAGSECQKDTNAEGSRQREASNINKSLLALSNVINALQNGKQVPSYRDSKLTFYLQDSLGGNAQTVIICTMNQENNQQSTSKSTLQFAMKAMKIKNTAKVNKIKSDKVLIEELKRENKKLQIEVERLKNILNGNGDIDAFHECNLSMSSKENDSSALFNLSNDIIVPPKDEIEPNDDSFAVTEEEIICLPKKKKRTFDFLPKNNSNLKTPEKVYNTIELSPSMDESTSPIFLPKKIKSNPIQITESEKLSDEETDHHFEAVSREILEGASKQMKFNASIASLNSDNEEQISVQNLKQDKEKLLIRIADLERMISEKEKTATHTEQLQSRITELEGYLQERDNSFLILNQKIKQQENDIMRLNEEVAQSKTIELSKQSIDEYEMKLQSQADENLSLKKEIQKMTHSLSVKDAQVKGLTINNDKLKTLLGQKDSYLANYIERVDEDKKDSDTKIQTMQTTIEQLTQQNNELLSRNDELSSQSENEARRLNEAMKIKYTEFSTKYNQLRKMLQNEITKNKELEDQKSEIEKKLSILEQTRSQSIFPQSRFDGRITDKDITEISIPNESMVYSTIEQNPISLKLDTSVIQTLGCTRKPLQPKDPNHFMVQKTLIEKFHQINPELINEASKMVSVHQTSQTNNRTTAKTVLNIEESTVFEYVNRLDELYSSQRDTSISKKSQVDPVETTEIYLESDGSSLDLNNDIVENENIEQNDTTAEEIVNDVEEEEINEIIEEKQNVEIPPIQQEKISTDDVEVILQEEKEPHRISTLAKIFNAIIILLTLSFWSAFALIN